MPVQQKTQGELLDIVKIVNAAIYGWVSSVSLRWLRSRGGTIPQFPTTLGSDVGGMISRDIVPVVSFINGRKMVMFELSTTSVL